MARRPSGPPGRAPAAPRRSPARPRQQLLLAHVEGPHRERAGRNAFEQRAVRLELHVLGERVGRCGGQEELRAVEPDTLGAGGLDGRDVLRQLDVRPEGHGNAVARERGTRGDRGPVATRHRRHRNRPHTPQVLLRRVED